MIHYRKQLTECPLDRERVGAGHNFWEIKRGSHLNLPLLAGGHFVIVFYVRLFFSFDSCGAESVASDKVPIKQSRDKRGRK